MYEACPGSERPLSGIVAYFDAPFSDNLTMMRHQAAALGARVLHRWNAQTVTHCIWEYQGSVINLKRALDRGVTVVSSHWITACVEAQQRVSEQDFMVTDDEVAAIEVANASMKNEQPAQIRMKSYNHNENWGTASNKNIKNSETLRVNCSSRKRRRVSFADIASSSMIKNRGKRLRRRKNTEKRPIVANSAMSDGVKLVLHKVLRELRGTYHIADENDEKFDILVVEQRARTMKLLFAIARGAWILDAKWLFDSLDRGSWCDLAPYETLQFSAAHISRLKHAQSEHSVGLLDGLCVYVDSAVDSSMAVKELVLAAGGRLSFVQAESDLILGLEATRAENLAKDIPIVRTSWLFDSLENYNILDYEMYQYRNDEDAVMPDSPTY